MIYFLSFLFFYSSLSIVYKGKKVNYLNTVIESLKENKEPIHLQYSKIDENEFDSFFYKKLNLLLSEYNNSNNKNESESSTKIIEFIENFQNPTLSLTSKNGFSGDCWGPGLWKFLHMISFNYPMNPTEDQKKLYYDFMLSIGKVLPCKVCRDNYENNLDNIKFQINALENRKTFSEFMFNLHNEVNRKLGKSILKKMPQDIEVCRKL